MFYIEDIRISKTKLPDKITRKINQETIPAFCNILKNTSWANVLSEKTPKLAFDTFFDIFNSARDVAFPEIKVKQKPMKISHSPWMTKGLRVSQKRKEKLFAKKVKKTI